ncbi:hypothetical protein OC845_001133 [Tilletia horrida]|nr:hypothetical protein OC845_001133 [Tilletia horrida]
MSAQPQTKAQASSISPAVNQDTHSRLSALTSGTSKAAVQQAAAAQSGPTVPKEKQQLPPPAPAKDVFPAHFHKVNQEQQKRRLSVRQRGLTGMIKHVIWKAQYTIGTHTSLSMLETWEVLFVLFICSLFVGAVGFYIAFRLPAHYHLASERAAYYLFGTRTAASESL